MPAAAPAAPRRASASPASTRSATWCTTACKDATLDPAHDRELVAPLSAGQRRHRHRRRHAPARDRCRPRRRRRGRLADLEREHGALPPPSRPSRRAAAGTSTCSCRTGGRCRPSAPASSAPGIDHRCQGGYVVAPPSAIVGRPYAWSVDSADRFAVAPDGCSTCSASGGGNGKATPPEEWLALVTAGVDEGARNHTIARARRTAVPPPAASPSSPPSWSPASTPVKCRPPLEAAELKRTLDSIAEREMRRRGLSA